MLSSIAGESKVGHLMPSHGIMSTVMPSYLTPGIQSHISFPQWLGKQSSARKARRLNLELDLRTKQTTMNASPLAFRLDYVPALTRSLAIPLITKKQDGIDEAIDLIHTICQDGLRCITRAWLFLERRISTGEY